MAVKFPVKVSGRVRKLKQRPDITADSLKMLREVKLTRKICLGVTNSFVDFWGVACPFTLRFKLLMKQIFEDSSIGWNCEIGEAAADAWMELISEVVLTGSLIFPRTTRLLDSHVSYHLMMVLTRSLTQGSLFYTETELNTP